MVIFNFLKSTKLYFILSRVASIYRGGNLSKFLSAFALSLLFQYGFRTHGMYEIGEGVSVEWPTIQLKFKRPEACPEALLVIEYSPFLDTCCQGSMCRPATQNITMLCDCPKFSLN
jgi:hypothetical protein